MTQSDINGVKGIKQIVPVGATVAVLISPLDGETGSLIKYFTGGSLEIVQAPVRHDTYGQSSLIGLTWAGASLVALQGTGYLFGSSEVVSVDGPARYYLMATGATVTCYLLKGLTAGY